MGVVGSIAAGHGLKGLQTFLASLDLPSMGHDDYDALMDAVVRATRKVGQRSFRAAREAEIWALERKGAKSIMITNKAGKSIEVWEIPVTFDGAWPKRGTRKSGYNSLGGMTSVMGQETGKVLDVEVLSTTCGICDRERPAGEAPPEHECYKNYEGSAKSMEPMGAVNLFRRAVEQHGVIYTQVTGDADSSFMTTLDRELPAYIYEHVRKELCTGHLKGNLYDKLSKLKASHFKRVMALFPMLIKPPSATISRRPSRQMPAIRKQ
jgi:hypothetical protein